MVARKFFVHHNDANFNVDYDTDHGFDVLKYQLFSLTSIPPDEQRIFGGEDDHILSNDSDLNKISDKLRLVPINEEVEGKVEDKETTEHNAIEDVNLAISDEEFARMLQAEEDALLFQQFVASEDKATIEQKIRPYVSQVLMYEDRIRQAAARKTVPVDELEENSLVALAKEGNFTPIKGEQDHAFLLQLLSWFKKSFSWVNAPPCEGCGNETFNHGMGDPLPSEILFGGSRVELYRCNCCSMITRFPRYNDPVKLVETRRGRCGEWANCFTLYCRAFGYESRLILDFTDHVWTECFSHSSRRWMHLDPCEGAYDRPLLYEKGWKKGLSYVIAIARDGVYDVTKRYTRKWHEVLSRRNIATEPVLSSVLDNITKECRKSFTSQQLSLLEDRDKSEIEELERELRSKDDSKGFLPERQSGDKQWRISRSEYGLNQNNSLGFPLCPVRFCVDEHVTRIYDAFPLVLSSFVERGFSKSLAVEYLETFRGILKDFRNSPFREREVFLDPSSISLQPFVTQMLPSARELLAALSIKVKLDADRGYHFSLAGDPVKTSMALPVVLDALDNIILNLKKIEHFDYNSLCMPLVKFNRICSGSVFASGEEFPLGVVTSAFDGICSSKWEEPNGARGCWLVYKLLDGKMHELVTYELMSANDAPERDPRDWVVEGSDDGGSNWLVLDKQTSQFFENRYERKTYSITPTGFLSNAFRFSFQAVRDVKATSRLQLSSIDLYARHTTFPTSS